MAELGTELHIDVDDGALSLRGEVDAHTAPQLESALTERAPAAGTARRVKLSGLTFMDSSGLRVIIAATDSARSTGGDIVLVDPSNTVRRLIEVSGLSGHLTIEPPDA